VRTGQFVTLITTCLLTSQLMSDIHCLMTTIRGNAGSNWVNYCKAVFEQGSDFYDESEKIKELLDVFLIFESFDPNDPIFQKFTDSKLTELYRRKMVSQEIIPELGVSYGKRLYNQMGIDQVKWLTDRLKRKPETKAATISLLLPEDPGPRIPCLAVVDVKIRAGKVNLTCFYRSQNASRGYGNFIGIHDLHQKIAGELSLPLGEMKIFISSAHIYEKDFPFITDLIAKTSALV
jgi:thymidylate synthase